MLIDRKFLHWANPDKLISDMAAWESEGYTPQGEWITLDNGEIGQLMVRDVPPTGILNAESVPMINSSLTEQCYYLYQNGQLHAVWDECMIIETKTFYENMDTVKALKKSKGHPDGVDGNYYMFSGGEFVKIQEIWSLKSEQLSAQNEAWKTLTEVLKAKEIQNYNHMSKDMKSEPIYICELECCHEAFNSTTHPDSICDDNGRMFCDSACYETQYGNENNEKGNEAKSVGTVTFGSGEDAITAELTGMTVGEAIVDEDIDMPKCECGSDREPSLASPDKYICIAPAWDCQNARLYDKDGNRIENN